MNFSPLFSEAVYNAQNKYYNVHLGDKFLPELVMFTEKLDVEFRNGSSWDKIPIRFNYKDNQVQAVEDGALKIQMDKLINFKEE